MFIRINEALENSRLRREEGEKGFTLIELLVVVLIIGILSAIAIPIFLGQQNQAKESATKSDLTNLKTAVVSYATANNGTYPTNADLSTTVFADYGFVKSENTSDIEIVSATATGICLAAKSTTGAVFYITNAKGVYSASASSPACGAPTTFTVPTP